MEIDVKEISRKLEEYRENREKVEEAIKKNSERTQDEESRVLREKDLKKLLSDIEKAINIQQDLLSVSSTKIETFFSLVKLRAEDIGKKCNLYYEKDQLWYPGEINSVNVVAQSAEVTFLGFNEKYLIPASYIQILIPPKVQDLQEGKDVEVLLSDGKWHYGSILGIIENDVEVKLARWGHKTTVQMDSIRVVKEEKKPLIEKEIFSIPEKLKIRPNDPENVRKKKKKKIKALKSAWRMNQTEKETKFYTSSWKTFQKTGAVKKNSIFQVPEGYTGKIGVAVNCKKDDFIRSKVKIDELNEDGE